MSAARARRLPRSGIGVGGAYYGESFYNWGGFNQGGEYDGVLELYLNADMKKLGLWKGLCFHTNGYQIHGNSITAANIGSLMPVSNLEATDATRLVRAVVRADSSTTSSRSDSGSSPPTPSSSSAMAAAISSTAPGAGRRSPPPICRAAARPILWPRPACASPSIRTTRWASWSASITAIPRRTCAERRSAGLQRARPRFRARRRPAADGRRRVSATIRRAACRHRQARRLESLRHLRASALRFRRRADRRHRQCRARRSTTIGAFTASSIS